MHFAAIGGRYTEVAIAVEAEHEDAELKKASPGLAAQVQGECNELVGTMCASMFLNNKYRHEQVCKQVMAIVRRKVDSHIGLGDDDSREITANAKATAVVTRVHPTPI